MTKRLFLPLTAFLLFYSIGLKAQVAAALSQAGLKPTPSAIGFVENKGRFRAMDGQAHPELLFKLPGHGARVFSTSQPDQRWDGIFEGRLQEAGAFVYTCEYNIGEIHKQVKGTIILVR